MAYSISKTKLRGANGMGGVGRGYTGKKSTDKMSSITSPSYRKQFGKGYDDSYANKMGKAMDGYGYYTGSAQSKMANAIKDVTSMSGYMKKSYD